MPPITLLIKPASSNCNLRCNYCFYHSLSQNRQIKSYGIMSADTLEILVKKALDYAEYYCNFAFQGGEPTIAGIDFYKNLVGFVNKYNKRNIKINYSIQTNGVLINEEWAEFFYKHKFLVGISLDGPKDIHDSMRVDTNEKGSFTRVMRALQLFNRFKVEYNILCVVNNFVARHISQVYEFFKKNDFQYLQFIPCLDPLNEEPGAYEYSLTNERFANFLKTLFDLWYKDIMNGRAISVRYFDNLINMAMGKPPESCGMSGVCSPYYVIEANGGVYPCDFYVIDKWYMGNILENDFELLEKSGVSHEFSDTSLYTDPECKCCQWYGLCRGGCRRDREPFIDFKPGLNRFCTAYKEFFQYSSDRIYHIARILSQRR